MGAVEPPSSNEHSKHLRFLPFHYSPLLNEATSLAIMIYRNPIVSRFEEITRIVQIVDRQYFGLSCHAHSNRKQQHAGSIVYEASKVLTMLKQDLSPEEKASWEGHKNRVEVAQEENAAEYLKAAEEMWRFTVRAARRAFQYHSLNLNPEIQAQTVPRSGPGQNPTPTPRPETARFEMPHRSRARVPRPTAMPAPWTYDRFPRQPHGLPAAYTPTWVPAWLPSPSPVWYPIPIVQYY
ncbi:hypothetical protein DAEQUDRAFT_100211 [Daedalea quercina L-15889]|uniref:Uncharacterized protein n=1 Tax=Daedalea quercina L-15889 TaxID=1314783 RepID=A0A165KX70_9APHY|nr:hypothetical protein DAEQUDRAFT_100211 [Daedalea quercina L-15889]